ncbi:neutral/alkaline non-lysosomal ceramidase N-terminal domain-containing protein [Companilactobacillus formosensis]|uniref:neutral/alkaline non-lysosomal ceramidase N-terminal domain-containing protein n=1 Tax=Companilactobacillus formosensis TaxID=1617889 RepID=UPI000E64F118|nr:neutral/alkaline non-lysosomal ceramidase N-terminal domain-containing protein [Companilactobacillus formosensis]
MLIGHGRIDITPSGTFYLLGYKNPMRNDPAKGVHDHIFINGLLFHNSKGEECFLATGDLLELEDIVAADIRQKISSKFNIAMENIVIGVTHDHHSVRDYHRTWEFGKYNQKYYDFFVDSFVKLFDQCKKSLINVTVQYGQKLVLGYYSNRNHKGQQSDNIVSVTKFIHEGKAIAGIVNLAVHSTVLSANNMYLTGDLSGNLSKELYNSWGFYPLMLVGCAADSSNHYDRQGKDFDELQRVVIGLSKSISTIDTSKTINMVSDNIHVITQSQEVISDKQSYDRDLKETIQELENGTKKIVGSQTPKEIINKCENQLSEPQFHDVISMEILDIGDLRIFVFPGELASAGAKMLRASTDKTVLIAGYSNGFHYYFLQAKDYGLSFETIGNPVPAGTFEEIISKFVLGSRMLDVYEKN